MPWGVSASHVPVLTLLPKLFPAKRVLEIGSGELSTPLFLDKKIYPDLEKLVSVESDPEWLKKISKLTQDDRLTFLPTVPAAMYAYDLIFVDGPQDREKRAKTIGYVMRELLPALIVVHDIEVKSYRKEIDKVYRKFEFNFVKSPMTGIYSRDALPLKPLEKYNKIMKKNFNEVQENRDKWKELLK